MIDASNRLVSFTALTRAFCRGSSCRMQPMYVPWSLSWAWCLADEVERRALARGSVFSFPQTESRNRPFTPIGDHDIIR